MAIEEQTSPQASTVQEDAARSRRIRFGLLSVLAVVAVIALVFGVQWWLHGRFVEKTNDAYLRADQVTISPKVSGYVQAIYVGDNQAVAAGQPLIKIDPVTYEAGLAAQVATIEGRRADVEVARRQVEQQAAATAEADAQLKGAQDAAAFAEREAERYRALSAEGVETQQRYAQAVNEREQARAKLRAAQAAREQAKRGAATLAAQVGQTQAQLRNAEAQANSARINIDETLLRAPIGGRIGDRSVRVGQLSSPAGG
jgi:membrane fusion protein (multidrug efflux system)